jgi:hypothetical protein
MMLRYKYKPKPAYIPLNQTIPQMTTLRKVGESIEKMGAKALLCGTLGSGISYYLLKRQSAVEMLGMDLAEWQLDGVLMAIESISGDLVGSYTVPYIEQKFVGNETLEKAIKWGLPPALVGTQHVLVKKYMTDATPASVNDLVLGAAVKFVADSAVNTYMPNL